MAPSGEGAGGYHIFVYGKHKDPLFQKYKVAAESLAEEQRNVQCTVEGHFEAQYEQLLRHLASSYRASFAECKPSSAVIFAETEDSVLYFAGPKRFFDWALKRFKYEDHKPLYLYRCLGAKARAEAQAMSGRSYAKLAFETDEPSPDSAVSIAVNGLEGDTPNEEAVREAFEQFGTIDDIEFAVAADKFKGSCVIVFDDAEAAKAAVANGGNLQIGGKPVSVAMAAPPEAVVHFELFDEECPALTKNFHALLKKPNFNGHHVHRIKARSWIQAGDLVDGSGAHSEAAEGGLLRHESYVHKHDREGLLGMCCSGKDTIGSQFYVTLRDLPFLDGSFVVIGRVITGTKYLWKVDAAETKNERPVKAVKVFTR